MRILLLTILAFVIYACAEPEPTPIIMDLEDGTVRTQMEELVPLQNYRAAGVTQVLMVPDGLPGPDPVLGPLDRDSRARAVAVGNYSRGLEPEVVLAPATKGGTYMGTPAASLHNISVTGYDEGLGAEAIAALITDNYVGKRIVLVAEVSLLEDIADAIGADDVLDWPVEGRRSIAFVTAGGEEPTAQVFALAENEE